MKSIKVLFTLAGNIIQVLFGLVYFFLIRIIFSYEVIGIYGAILSNLQAFLFIADLGFSTAHLKYYQQAENMQEKKEFNTSFLFFRVIQISIYSSVLLIIIPFLNIHEGDTSIIYIFLLAEIFRVIGYNYLLFVLLSEKLVVKRLITLLTTSIMNIVFLYLFTFLIHSNVRTMALIYLASNLLYFTILMFFARHVKYGKLSYKAIKLYFKFSLPFFFTTITSIIIANIDTILINQWYSTIDVANYFTAKQIYVFYTSVLVNLAYILIPLFSENLKTNNKENLILVSQTQKYLNFLFIFNSLFLVLYSSTIISFLFGSNYQFTSNALTFFSFDLVLTSINYINIIYIQSSGDTKFFAIFSTFQNLLCLLLMYLLISPDFFGLAIIGGPLALAISNLVSQLIFRPIFYKKYQLGFYWGFFRNIGIILVIYFIQIFINMFIQITIINFVAFLALDFLLFLGLNYLLKGITKDDIHFIRTTFTIKNLYQTASSEFKENE